MTAEPFMGIILDAFRLHQLEAVLIGNAAAALQGAPVTTDDFDFFFRDTPANVRKLREIAKDWGTSLTHPHEPLSGLYRIETPKLRLDMMGYIEGNLRFESVRSRADSVRLGSNTLLVASLADVIKSKQAAGRKKDKAVLPILREVLRGKK
jgi:predicted nucleotidyltransferase